MSDKFKDDDFKEIVASPFVKMDDKETQFILNDEKIGNTLFAKLLSREIRPNDLAKGKTQEIYTMEMEDGEEIRFAKGNVEDKGSIFKAMRKIVIGQWVKFVYDSIIPPTTKGYNPFKLVKVYEGPIDETENLADEMDGEVLEDDGLPPMK